MNDIFIPYVDLKMQWKSESKELLSIIEKVLYSGKYINSQEVDNFEKNISTFCETNYAAALNSGTDALVLALHLSGVSRGDEVITPPNSFISSTSSIVHLGARPIFVDVCEDQNMNPDLIERAITSKTKAIMPVHLTGRVCKMDQICEIAKKYGLSVIEDAAQSIGSKYKNQFSGTFGNVGCFSAHPLKNLNACGDSGFITTNDEEIYNKFKELRNHGQSERNIVNNFGYVSRMDSLQAAILSYRLKNINNVINKRRKNAQFYFENIKNRNLILPYEKENEFNTYHTFVIQTEDRDNLKSHLLDKGIKTSIHYPVPIHLQPAAKYLGYQLGDFPITESQASKILTLPINQFLSEDNLNTIITVLNNYEK